jgi:hypothetical protein
MHAQTWRIGPILRARGPEIAEKLDARPRTTNSYEQIHTLPPWTLGDSGA